MISTTVEGTDEIKQELEKLLASLDVPGVTVGIHSDESDPPEGQINMATLGAVHEFGAEINHPGGTNYGYKTKQAASKGQVRFMKKGEGFMVLGQTKPHQIKIPARAWLAPGFESGFQEYVAIMEEGIIEATEGGDILDAMNRLGVVAVGKVQAFMTQLKSPPNKPGTIKKKGSSNPLIDEGLMRGSVNYKLATDKPEEGL